MSLKQIVDTLAAGTIAFAMLATSVSANQITLRDLSHEQQATLARISVTFAEFPDLIPVAFCESSLAHYNPDGSVKLGVKDPRDTGLMQINTRWHLEAARALGFDIFTEAGNKGYALHLRSTEGIQPWDNSRECWQDLTLPDVRVMAGS